MEEIRDEATMAEFYDLVDKFINLANELTGKYNTTRISSVLSFAAARYSVFNFYATDGSIETERVGVEYYLEQYQLMLEDNFERTRNLYKE